MAIAYDATATGISVDSPLTFEHTCGSGKNRLLVVAATGNNTNTVTGVTYGGVAMTETGSVTDANNATAYLFYLVNPATGANNVVVTTTGLSATGSSISYTGVDQDNPIDATDEGATEQTTDHYTATITSTVDNCWSIMTTRCGSGHTWTGDAGTTVRQQPEQTYLGSNGMVDSGAAIATASEDTLGVTSTSQLFPGGLLITIAPSLAVPDNAFLAFFD